MSSNDRKEGKMSVIDNLTDAQKKIVQKDVCFNMEEVVEIMSKEYGKVMETMSDLIATFIMRIIAELFGEIDENDENPTITH